jgi:hypothetical protein
MISNPRLQDNNLSRHINDCPADWVDFPVESTIELIACPATVPLVAVGNGQYQGYLDVRYNSDLEGTVTPWLSFEGDAQTTWSSGESWIRVTITFDTLPGDSTMGSIYLRHDESGIRSEVRKFTFSNEVSISADLPVVTLYLGNNIDYEGFIRGTFTPNMSNSPLDSTAISGSARVVEGHSNNLATGFWVRPGFEFNPSGYWEGYVHLTPSSQTLPENPNLEVSITVAGKTSTIYVPIVQG